MLEAIGAIVLFTAGLTVIGWMLWRDGWKRGYQAHHLDMAERRALRRAEARAQAPRRPSLAPFPGAEREPFEQLATTGELRKYAETGDIGSLKRETAAFFRVLALRDHTRKKGVHAA